MPEHSESQDRLDAHELRPVLHEQANRAGGVLLGAALADGWSSAIEGALCVADVAATGVILSDRLALELLERNLETARRENRQVDEFFSLDGLHLAGAVVALASFRDDSETRAQSADSVLASLSVHSKSRLPITRDDFLGWIELVNETLWTGNSSERFATGLRSVSGLPAASGALLGARDGWQSLPDDRSLLLTGWPGAGSTALIGLGVLAVQVPRRTDRSRPSDKRHRLPLSTESWPQLESRRDAARRTPEFSSRWRVSHTVLVGAETDRSDTGSITVPRGSRP